MAPIQKNLDRQREGAERAAMLLALRQAGKSVRELAAQENISTQRINFILKRELARRAALIPVIESYIQEGTSDDPQ